MGYTMVSKTKRAAGNGALCKNVATRFVACVAAMALAFAMTPAAAFAAVPETLAAPAEPGQQVERVNGLVPANKHIYHVPAKKGLLRAAPTSTFPATYRSDEQAWAQNVKMKDQGSSGLCWAFSVTTAAEYSYAKELYEAGGTGAISETSPGQLAYFAFNRVNDPLGNTAGDENLIVGNSSWALVGANQINAMQHLATFSGVGLEENTPFSSITGSIRNGSWKEEAWSAQGVRYGDERAYDNYITQQESVLAFTSLLEDNAEITRTVKDLVYTYGAVSGSLLMDTKQYMNRQETVEGSSATYVNGRSFYNYQENSVSDHAVTVIGWDDNYPKENFTHARNASGGSLVYTTSTGSRVYLSEEEAIERTTPPGDGAWIVQNSWGSSANDNGFFYVSYYSQGIGVDEDVYAFDMQPADTYAYNFQYDGTMDCGDASDEGNESFLTVKGTKAANVFENTTGKPMTLDAVGFTTYNDGATSCDIDVYTGLTDAQDPTSGVHAGTTHATTTTVGCKTALLDEPVTIAAGERFSIVFSFDDELTCFGVEKARSGTWFEYNAQIEQGQSFFKAARAKSWTDMHDYGACFRIKGLANEVENTDELTYQVVFEDGFGTVLDTQEVATGHAATAPEVAPREGYQFEGWDADYTNITGNLLVKALWTQLGTDPADDPADNPGGGSQGGSAGTGTDSGSAAPVSLAKAKVTLATTSFTYDGKAKKPAVKAVVLGGTALRAGRDYTVSYQNNTAAGTAKAVVKGTGGYTGSATATFTIKPAKGVAPNVASCTKSSAKLTWQKAAGATSYQLQWRARGGAWKTVAAKKTKATVKSLKKGKLYEFRVRGVAGSVKGAWSKAHKCYLRTVSGLKASSTKKGSVKAKWKKDSKANKGYRVLVRYTKSGAIVASKTVSKKKKSATVKGLKKGKKVWVQVLPLRRAGSSVYEGVVKTASKRVKVKK